MIFSYFYDSENDLSAHNNLKFNHSLHDLKIRPGGLDAIFFFCQKVGDDYLQYILAGRKSVNESYRTAKRQPLDILTRGRDVIGFRLDKYFLAVPVYFYLGF